MDDDKWYLRVGGCLGIIPAIVAFFGSWWYCTTTYGYLLGFGLGWLPSLILAAIVELAFMLLWAPALAAIAYFVLLPALRENDAPPKTLATTNADVPSYIDPFARDVLVNWLDEHPAYRVLTDADCQCEAELNDTRTQTKGAWKALPDYHPYFSKGDFNDDGIPDFAVIVSDGGQRGGFRVLIFSGDGKGFRSFLSGETGRKDTLHYGPPRPKPYRLLVGRFYAEGEIFEPSGTGNYVVQ